MMCKARNPRNRVASSADLEPKWEAEAREEVEAKIFLFPVSVTLSPFTGEALEEPRP